jgi:hypothetical protein
LTRWVHAQIVLLKIAAVQARAACDRQAVTWRRRLFGRIQVGMRQAP